MDRLSEIRARCEADMTQDDYRHMRTADITRMRLDMKYLLAEIEKINDELYDADGTNLVKYWHQQCQTQENGLYNYGKVCAAYKARAEKAEAERDTYKAALQLLELMISGEREGNKKREHSAGVVIAVNRARELLKGE